jgi:hypothetical protein
MLIPTMTFSSSPRTENNCLPLCIEVARKSLRELILPLHQLLVPRNALTAITVSSLAFFLASYLADRLIDFPIDTVQMCVPCKTVKYCPHCSLIAAPTHHHGTSNFVSQRDLLQTQLGGGWTQRKNPSGRIWYHHTRTNTHSFEFPQSAVGQAPEPSPAVPMKPTNPRRATTGGIPSSRTGPLPPGWEARKTADGRRYYANHSTKQTSWQRPASVSRPRPAGQPRHGSVPLQNHTGGVQWESQAAPVAHMTPEEKAAAKALAKKQAERKKMMTKIGTSVLKGVVTGVIRSEL